MKDSSTKCRKGHERVNNGRGRCTQCERDNARRTKARQRRRLGPEGLKALRRRNYEKYGVNERLAMRRYRKNNPRKVAAIKARWAARPDVRSRHRQQSTNHKRRERGWSVEAFQAAWKRQRGKCAICNIALTDGQGRGKTSAHADHCHTAKQPRGILCLNCNVGLGNFKDDISLLQKAIEYLAMYRRQHKQEKVTEKHE